MAIGVSRDRRRLKRLHRKGLQELVSAFTYAPRLSIFRKGVPRHATVHDISTEGLAFTSHELLYAGSRLDVVVHFSSGTGFSAVPAPVKATASVIRCKEVEEGEYAVGVMFQKIGKRAQKEIAIMIELAVTRGMGS